MNKNTKAKIELFKKITDIHFATDYSSIDYLYPPLFSWRKTRPNDGIQKGLIFSKIKPGNYSLYIHFPFCLYKCAFCRQFSVPAIKKNHYDNYVDLLLKELNIYAPYFRRSRLTGIYLGGGTPTLFDLEKVLKRIYQNFNLCSPSYLNIESTPDSLDKNKLITLKKMGLTRLLIGIQSFDPKVLKAIGRPTFQLNIFKKIYKYVWQAGIPYASLELVCGLPRQTYKSFLKDLEYIVSLKPPSIHIYSFMQTPLTIIGQKNAPSESSILLRDKMYQAGLQILRENGYLNRGDDFVLTDEGRNPNYIFNRPNYDFSPHQGVLALGASSLGFYPIDNQTWLRTFNSINLNEYLQKISQNLLPIKNFFILNGEDFLRMSLIKAYRYGCISRSSSRWLRLRGFNILKIYTRFKKEFSFLEKAGQAKIDDSFSRIDFKQENWLIYSKIFYSQKVLKRCQQIINSKKFQNLPI